MERPVRYLDNARPTTAIRPEYVQYLLLLALSTQIARKDRIAHMNLYVPLNEKSLFWLLRKNTIYQM